MIFIYDILVNFNDNYYEFYEWNENDTVEHIRKIPLIKVKKEMIQKIIEKNIVINKMFLGTIQNKCEIFNSKSIEYIEYGCIFCDLNRSVVVSFNKEGYIMELSSILINEELEIIDVAETLLEKEIKYKELYNKYERNNFTRKDLKVINNIIFELEKIKDDKEKTEYLCYEWFGTSENASYKKLINSIKKNFTEKHKEFMELLKLVV